MVLQALVFVFVLYILLKFNEDKPIIENFKFKKFKIKKAFKKIGRSKSKSKSTKSASGGGISSAQVKQIVDKAVGDKVGGLENKVNETTDRFDYNDKRFKEITDRQQEIMDRIEKMNSTVGELDAGW